MQLLKIRYYQLKRDLGLWVPIIAIAAFLLVQTVALDRIDYAAGIALIYFTLAYRFHQNRRDLVLVRHLFSSPSLNLFVNYQLTALPVSLGLVFAQQYLPALALHLVLFVLLFRFNSLNSPLYLAFTRIVPSEQFEWIAGLRANFLILLVLLLLAIVLSPVKFFAIVVLFLLNSVILGFYRFNEPVVMLNPDGLEISQFLFRKIRFLQKAVLFINVPVLLVNCIFHPDVLWYGIGFIFSLFLLCSFTIYAKYANYEANQTQGTQIDALIPYFALLVPFLAPPSYYLSESYRSKAILKLNSFFNA